MDDTSSQRPDHTQLFEIATEQLGYFTAAQARAVGFRWNLLNHHVSSGRFIRIRRGLYRLRDYPWSAREDVMVAWLAVGKEVAVVSHESALDLLGLSDIVPDAIHLTVPRAKRHLPALPGVKIHTTMRPAEEGDVIVRGGIRTTAATRSILDAAETGAGPEQIELAIRQAIERGQTTREQLVTSAEARDKRVRQLIARALERGEG